MSKEFELLVDKITDKLADSNLIKTDEKAVYHFGIEITLLKLLHYISYITIALCMDRVWEFLVIFAVFYCFRRNAGGYHAKTRLGCYLFSCSLIAGSLWLTRIDFHINVIYVIAAADLVILHFLAPVQNANRTLDEEEVIFFKNRLLMISILFTAICLAAILANKEYLFFLFAEGLSLSVMLAIIGWFQRALNSLYKE